MKSIVLALLATTLATAIQNIQNVGSDQSGRRFFREPDRLQPNTGSPRVSTSREKEVSSDTKVDPHLVRREAQSSSGPVMQVQSMDPQMEELDFWETLLPSSPLQSARDVENVQLVQNTIDEDPEFASKITGPDVVPIYEICEVLHLDEKACQRVGIYLGRTLRDRLGKEPLRISHGVAERFHHFRGDTTTERGLRFADSDLMPSAKNPLMKLYADTFKYVRVGNVDDRHPFMVAADDEGWLKPWDYPTLVKPVPVNETSGNHVVTMLNRWRYEPPVEQVRTQNIDIPFEQKVERLIWRGASTGSMKTCNDGQGQNRSRMRLVSMYRDSKDPRIDVGFDCHPSHATCGDLPRDAPASFGKDNQGMEQLLRNKYIMVVEGNDVSSSTLWVLASNSAPFMAPPSVQTWDMQGWLKPWKHYVPVEPDFSDLVEKVEWAMSNPAKVEAIVNEGKIFLKEFADKDRELRIHAAVLLAYFNRFRIEPSAGPSAIDAQWQADSSLSTGRQEFGKSLC